MQEMQDDGGVLSACVNSACLSLLDACVSMKFLVAAVSCALGKDGTFYLDPDSKVVKNSAANLVFVFESRTKSLISTHSEGPVSQEQYQQCLNSAKNAVDKVFDVNFIICSGIHCNCHNFVKLHETSCYVSLQSWLQFN